MFVPIGYPTVQMHGTVFQCLCQLVMYLYMCTVLCSTVCVSWLPNCTDAWQYVPVFVSIGYSIVEMYGTMFQCLCQLFIQLYRCMTLCSNVCVNWLSNCTDARYYVPMFVSVGYPVVQRDSTVFQCLCQVVIKLYRCMALCSNGCVNWLSNCTDARYDVPMFVSVGYSLCSNATCTHTNPGWR